MKSITKIIQDRNIVLKGADRATQGGFTQVPNFVLESDEISPGAKLVYNFEEDPHDCIETDKNMPPGSYDIRYDVTIYQEQGIYSNKATRKFLTEGTAYLRLVVAGAEPAAAAPATPKPS